MQRQESLSGCSGKASSDNWHFPSVSFCHLQRTRAVSPHGTEWLLHLAGLSCSSNCTQQRVRGNLSRSPQLISPPLLLARIGHMLVSWLQRKLGEQVTGILSLYKAMWALPEKTEGRGKSARRAAQGEGHRGLAGTSTWLAWDISCVSYRGRG